jgi:L,D-transpeptidase-like protein
MSSVAFDQRRLHCALAAVAVLCGIALVRAGDASAASKPRFLLAHAPSGVAVHARPRGPVTATVAGRTPLRTPTWLWIVDRTPNGAWGRAVLPLRPNGRTGWIKLRGLRLVRTTTWVRASLREQRIWLMRGVRPVATWRAAIGASTTPTPIGRFSVTDRVLTGDPSGPFGWYALGLSGHQPNLPPQWAGGDQLAIHGTNDPASIGRRASYGCLRVSSHVLTVLRARVPLGTPVVVMRSRRDAQRVALRASLPRLQRVARRPIYQRPKPLPRSIDVPTIAANAAAAAPLTRHWASDPAT